MSRFRLSLASSFGGGEGGWHVRVRLRVDGRVRTGGMVGGRDGQMVGEGRDGGTGEGPGLGLGLAEDVNLGACARGCEIWMWE